MKILESIFSRLGFVHEDKIDSIIEDKVIAELKYHDVNESKNFFSNSVSSSLYDVEESKKPSNYTSSVTKTVHTVESQNWINLGLNVGVNPDIEQTVGKLRLAQDSSVEQWVNFPIARSIIENTKRYVLGRGLKFDCSVSEVRDYLQVFWKRNKMELRNKQDYRDYLLYGEIFLLLFNNESFKKENKHYDTPIIVRRKHSALVDDIEIDTDDFETILSFKVVQSDGTGAQVNTLFYLDYTHPQDDEEELGLPTTMNKTISKNIEKAEDKVKMMMFKYGTTFDLRGRVFMESVLRWNRLYMDFVYDRGRINHLRTKVFLIETRTAQGAKVLGNSFERMPKGGMKLVETTDRKFRFVEPKTGAQGAEVDAKMIGYLIGSGVSMPIHVLLQNAENENYASIKEAGNPFAQMIQDMQDDWKEHILNVFRYVIAEGVRQGVLQSEYEINYYSGDTIGEMKDYIHSNLSEGKDAANVIDEVNKIFNKEKRIINTVDIPLHIIFPDIIHSDPKIQAEVIKVYKELGIISDYTAMSKIGLNPEIEVSRMDKETEIAAEKQNVLYKKYNQDSFFKEEEDDDDKQEEK